MPSAGFILGAVLLGGAAFVVYRSRKPAPPKKDLVASSCEALCSAGGDPGGHSVCVTACEAAGGILGDLGAVAGAVNPFHDSTSDYANLSNDRDTRNKQLNGDVELPLPLADIGGTRAGVEGTVAKFKNGCTPFKGSPGWSACKSGTQSMWSEDLASATGQDDGSVDYAHLHGGGRYSVDQLQGQGGNVDAANTFTGQQGDMFTRGPFDWNEPTPYDSNAKAVQNGKAYPDPAGDVDRTKAWLDRGKLLRCPPGQAPDDITKGLTGRRGTAGVCSAPGAAGTEVGGGTTGCAAAGYTWDKASDGTLYVRRLRVGESPKCQSEFSTAPTVNTRTVTSAYQIAAAAPFPPA